MKKQGEKDSMRIKIVMFWVQGAVVEREREREVRKEEIDGAAGWKR